MPILGAAAGIAIMAGLARLPIYRPRQVETDWLLGRTRAVARLYRSGTQNEIVLSNGLVSRTFRLSPDGATVALDNLMTGRSMLRAVQPEAWVEVDGQKLSVGGLLGQTDLAYLDPAWLDSMKPDPHALHLVGWDRQNIVDRMPWVRDRHFAPGEVWPPRGQGLVFHYALQSGSLSGLKVDVHYELYDGIPLWAKWITVINDTGRKVRLNAFSAELLDAVEDDSIVDNSPHWRVPPMTIITDYSFGGMSLSNSTQTVHWEPEAAYTTQVNYDLKTPCHLEVSPPLGPDTDIPGGESLSSFHVFELIHDSEDRERQGLAIRRMFRLLAPWVTENPLILHLTSTDPAVVHTAIDQAADVGFELVILSFGSGLNMEDVSPANIAKYKAFRQYANSKGLEMGGYSLLASRHIDDADDVINPKTGKPGGAIFGYSPCLCSKWAELYFQHLKTFISETGFEALENDGSYPGDVCASTTHPGHHGLLDSQWAQYHVIANFYRWCRSRGVYLNVPDNYFLAGSNKTGMGYREDNWSLPREQQHIHARQNLYDGTWQKAPSMGWMFVPLVQYHGGGAAASMEPLKDHLQDYGTALAENLGWGAQACYRGPRLYDAPATRALVKHWVDWFKKYRDILESDVIHVRRADGVHMDCALHVNPSLPIKAMVVFYNPTDKPMRERILLPLYYSGLDGSCDVSFQGGVSRRAKLDERQRLALTPTVPAHGCTWYVIS